MPVAPPPQGAIGVLPERPIARREEVTEQLQTAFSIGMVLEDAKGIVAAARRGHG